MFIEATMTMLTFLGMIKHNIRNILSSNGRIFIIKRTKLSANPGQMERSNPGGLQTQVEQGLAPE